MVSISPSSYDYEEINELSQMLCYLKNKEMIGCYYIKSEETGEQFPEISDIDVKAIIATVEDALQQLLNFQEFGYSTTFLSIFSRAEGSISL